MAEKKLSLLEASHLLTPSESRIRAYITSNIQDVIIREQWEHFNKLGDKQFLEIFGSTINRMMEFLSSPIIRDVVSQTEGIIDFRKIMDEGGLLLVNLSPKNKISDDNARLLGTLIVNDLFLKARSRPKGSRPFYLYIDECARYINEDIGMILDEGRKFGLHLILAHQHLSQLKKAGDDVYSAVMTDARTKVVFGGLDTGDADILARKIFLGELDLEEPKKILNKPVVVGYIKKWLRNYSGGKSSSTSESYSTSSNYGRTDTDNTLFNEKGETLSTSESFTNSTGEGESSTSGIVETESHQEGYSETYIPELKVMPTQVYSLEEQIYKAMACIVNQKTQHAIIKIPDEQTKFVKTPDVNPGFVGDSRIVKFENKSYALAEFVKTKDEAKKHVEKRTALLKRVIPVGNSVLDIDFKIEDPTNFKENKPPSFTKE